MLILIQNNDLGISCVVEQSLFTVTVHSVLSNVAKIHSRLPAAMEFWLVCLGSNPGQADNIIRFAACCKYYSNSSI